MQSENKLEDTLACWKNSDKSLGKDLIKHGYNG